MVDPMIPRSHHPGPQKKLVLFAPYMHVYYLRAKINFYNIKDNNNTIKLINFLKIIMIFFIKSSSKPY